MAYDDGFYYGQCKVICEAETAIDDGKTVSISGGGYSNSLPLTNKVAEFLVPGRAQYTVSLLDGATTKWSGKIEAGYGECIHVMLADGYEPVIEKDFKPIKDNLTAENGVAFKFGIDANGKYGYIKDGADSVTPFNQGYFYQLSEAIGGGGKTINIAEWLASAGLSSSIDYKKLTTDDFILAVNTVSAYEGSKFWNGSISPQWGNAGVSVGKSYNASNGILTVNNSNGQIETMNHVGSCIVSQHGDNYQEVVTHNLVYFGTTVIPYLCLTRQL